MQLILGCNRKSTVSVMFYKGKKIAKNNNYPLIYMKSIFHTKCGCNLIVVGLTLQYVPITADIVSLIPTRVVDTVCQWILRNTQVVVVLW